MKFDKVKKLHSAFQKELDSLSESLSLKFEREMIITPTSDGLCVIFEDQDATGIALDDFEKMMEEPGFDTLQIVTIL